MKKNGFTLVETLGVATLIAGIVLLVLPSFFQSIDESKEDLYETQLNNIKESARLYFNIYAPSDVLNYTIYLSDCTMVIATKKNENFLFEVVPSYDNSCEA
jgi:type II secretory pathway pseudopilin PulG